MEQQIFDKDSPKEDEKVIILPSNGVQKILIREDTILANLHGCAGCGRAQFSCSVQKQWSALCWGQQRQSDKKYYSLVLLLSGVFVLSLIGSIFFCFTNTINDAILSNMIIRNNTLAYSIWRRPNVQPLMKVHIFNYTNWERVRYGWDRRLRVQDVGPYVYSQQVERVNVMFDEDRLSFQEQNSFRYLPNKTVGAHYDQVHVPNLPLIGAASRIPYFPELPWINHPYAFVNLPVHKFLWGYEDDIINYAKPFLSLTGQLKFDKFGLLVTKNGTVSETLTINTGERHKDKMNLIQEMDGQDHLSYWSSPECNSLEGTDGSIFPPTLLDRKTTLYVFYPNLCRRIPYVYEKDVEIEEGIKLLRYRMPRNVFDDPVHNSDNQCFCDVNSGVCPPRGVINVTACTMGAPAMISFPHFYLGDPSLREEVEGMTPDPALHDNYLDLHPTLGIALRGKSSLQINVQVKKTTMSAFSFLKDGILLPVAWIEMGVEELPESLRSLVYHGTFSTAAVQLGLMVTSVIAFAVSGVCLMLLMLRKRQKPCITIKKMPMESEMKALQSH